MKVKRILRAVPREMTMEEHECCKQLFRLYQIIPVEVSHYGSFYEYIQECEYHYFRLNPDGMIVLPSTGHCYWMGKIPLQTRFYIYDEFNGHFKGILPAYDLDILRGG